MSNFDNNDIDFEDENPPEEESNNRTFLFIAGGLGVVLFLAIICIIGYLLLNGSGSANLTETAIAQTTQQAGTIQAGLTQTAAANALTATSNVTSTLPPTSTPVVAQVSDTPAVTVNPATATVGAAFTQIAASQTVTPLGANTTQTVIPTSTALPNTGFADEVGIPGMLIATLALVVIVFLTRRLRTASV